MSGFVDESQLNVRGGDGGAGCVSMLRESHVPMGGPDGGDGGRGGDIYLVADRNVASLLAFRDHPHRRADSGTHGSSRNKHGHGGDDLVVTVPIGTTVRDLYTDEVLADLTNDGDRWLAAAGGQGGRGNARFMSRRNKGPSFAEQGEHGEERWLKLELRLMADVALVGFPNAGKSTFISRVSAAKPKIADYPFTTLEPHLGVVRFDDGFEMVLADLPGLIEGASEGRGLGHQFLRHIERARVLLVLVDLAAVDGRSPAEQAEVLLHELGSYKPELLERPRLIVGSKADVAQLESPTELVVSAVTGAGVRPVLGALAKLVGEARSSEPVGEGFLLHRPAPAGVRVAQETEGVFRVHGREAERTVALNDVTSADALAHIDHRLKKIGVDRALVRAGARPGDVVLIGSFSFSYEPDD
jgi:GTP-binding protein